ncbi:pectate lyase superfamily protein-domain-containing protein [Favolaschia claudopus]|uniref:Pectate lyase superfamily protein-domain-containing protein n=1 Tax=Favolaschia claudopus TaxID=2862362 RepID=A0AAW0BDF4_9AGAR
MLPSLVWSALAVFLGSVGPVASLGTSCSAPLGSGSAAAGDPFWLADIKHQGISAFNPNPSSYQVFRNVKDFGAIGDGVHDDTNAINQAISTGGRCQGGASVCNSTTITPAVVYFPQGTYLVSAPIVALYYTQLIGDAKIPPTLIATPGFSGVINCVIDADPYIPGGNGAQFYTNQNNFFRSVRNFVIDTTRMPPSVKGIGIHWQVSQSTSLMNIVINLNDASDSIHQGIAIENGSGGFMGDIIVNGGDYGLWVGNQQFTVRNVTVNNAHSAVFGIWNWGWTFQGIQINNCGVGFDLQTGMADGGQTVGAEAIIDTTVTDTPIFVRTSTPSNGQLISAASLVLNNIKLTNVPTAVLVGDKVVLAGGTTTIESWAQGNVYKGTSAEGKYTQGTIPAPPKPAVLLDGSGKIFGKTHPQYAAYSVSEFVSVRDQGAKGDGVTDDTKALKAVFDTFAGCKIIFFDAGTYIVTSTLQIPAGTRVVGEGWSVIAGKGATFQDVNSPKVVVQVGAPGSSGLLEITDIMFSTIGPAPGAIVVEWNVKQETAGGAGMWDSHIRLGGSDGTGLQDNCPSNGSGGIDNCFAAFLALHLTESSTAYLEGTWVWLADHNIDGNGDSQISLFSGRGILSESAGPVWMIGTGAEHHTLYQYRLVNAQNHYMGLIQTETPYYQPSPAVPSPFTLNSAFKDPSFDGVNAAWGLSVQSSSNILVFGAGLYNFFAVLCLSLVTVLCVLKRLFSAAASDPFWMQTIKHQGISAFNSNPSSYQVFRNVKDFGAKGDGVTDDSAAINAAITAGNRCGGGSCASSTVTPAVVYFPSGTYLVSKSIISYYYTQLIGDAKRPPTLLATSSFSDIAVIDVDPYIPGGNGAQWYTNQNNFFRSVRNFVIDYLQPRDSDLVFRVPATSQQGTGIHWQVAQATSLMNIVINMSTASNTAHQGIWMENGSGGFMGDLVFNGGKFGMWVGNQQFTVRNVTFNNAQTAVFGNWAWGWTFQGVTINNCQVGFDLATGGGSAAQTWGAQNIIDATASNTPIFLRTSQASNGVLGGSIVLNNVRLNNVPTAVGVAGGATVLAGGSTTIASWGQGNVFRGSSGTRTFTQGNIPAPNKPSSLLDSSGRIFGKTHPQYGAYSVSQFVSVRDQGAKGDGRTDDTAALKAIFAAYAGCKIIFFDAGTYVVTSTIQIPAGTQIVGEAWSVIAGRGSAFQNANSPQVVVQVGAPGSTGLVEINDIIFSTIGPTAGAIVVEWNVKQSSQGSAGMWDSHIRLGGTAGTNLQISQCPSSGSGGTANCMAAYAALHLTPQSSGYFEGTWVWLADHDLDSGGQGQISIFSGRGILSESAGPVWMIGTASEHHTLYEYNLVKASNHYLGLIQTESPYYQPNPAPPAPFTVNTAFQDPSNWSGITAAWGLRVTSSTNIIVFGAGLYSFFQNYGQNCLTPVNCQSQITNIDSTSSVNIYGLSTVGTTFQLSVNQAGVINQSQNANGNSFVFIE